MKSSGALVSIFPFFYIPVVLMVEAGAISPVSVVIKSLPLDLFPVERSINGLFRFKFRLRSFWYEIVKIQSDVHKSLICVAYVSSGEIFFMILPLTTEAGF